VAATDAESTLSVGGEIDVDRCENPAAHGSHLIMPGETMTKLPGPPRADVNSALAYLAGLTQPTADDLRLLAVVEASGEYRYRQFADRVDNAPVKDVLLQNGREEMVHAHRAATAFEQLTGQPCAVPKKGQNPYCLSSGKRAFTAATRASMMAGAISGEALCSAWANSLADPSAAGLLRQNGAEERGHGERLQTIAHWL